MTPQEIEPDLPVSVQESLGEVWVDSGLPGLTGVSETGHTQQHRDSSPKLATPSSIVHSWENNTLMQSSLLLDEFLQF